MIASAKPAHLDEILPWREQYRGEMSCQIIHDSIHHRPGWTQEYVLSVEDAPVGYASVAVGGPWKRKPAAYEFYVEPVHRVRMFDLFQAFLDASGAARIEVQSNDVLAATMLHTFASRVTSESILFQDHVRTAHRPSGATFRHPREEEAPADAFPGYLKWGGVVEVDGEIAATGGILFHYNPPYGDIFMDTCEPFRRRGFGAFLVQELKRVCYEGGFTPGARCRTGNVASRRTLQAAGFVPCGHILVGNVRTASARRG